MSDANDGTALHYIDGGWVSDPNAGLYTSFDPATGELVGKAELGNADLASRALKAAREAFETTSWASDPRLRARVLLAFADNLQARHDDLANLLVRENGKILAQAKGEIAAGFGEARYYAGLARNVFGRTTETGPGNISLITREAAGVVSVIVPWNAPVTLLVRSIAPALAAGCTIVVKPAPQTPIVHSELIRCFHEIAELPSGVVNSVNENGIEVGHMLSTHKEVDVISFTGSSATGKTIMKNAAETMKHVSLELGGKAPAVVFEDADIDNAVAEIRKASIVLTGQMCTAISRVLVHRSILQDVTTRLKSTYESVKIGHGLKSDTEMGPLIDKDSQHRLLRIIEKAGDEANLILRGTAGGSDFANGAFITPSIFSTDDVGHALVQDEHFGPIISIEPFETENEAVEKANATRYGLASSVYTKDLNRAMRLGRRLKFGNVWLNCHNRLLAEVETGGFRESGIGRLHGVEAMSDFLETKHIYMETGH